ncbi:cell division protein FtsZ [Persicitalea sp.]|uniref:cell division protein FtsZ n=1 Tax=Persicitalea sp. TaxID=3100273 RepID=UPI0035931C2E
MDSNLYNALDQDYIINGIEENAAEPSIIKVIGVGGGGSNAVNYMYEKSIKDVEFAICNTDRQALLESPVPTKIQLGATLTKGLGAGMEIARGREAALETIEEIKALLGGATQMVFITAGLGGGTGTGAAPVIAQIAKEEMNLLTVSVVTAPYSWEGTLKKKHAFEGIEQLKKYSDTVLVVLNDKLEELFEDMRITEAFVQADSILLNAVKSISEIITTRGNINTDFKDVERVLKQAGQSVMGTAEVEGEKRAFEAVRKALDSPLLNDRDIKGAERILVTLASSTKREATMREQTEIWKYVLSQVGGEAHLFKLGTITDDTLGDKLRVTVVAAGFDSIDSLVLPSGTPSEGNLDGETEGVAEATESALEDSGVVTESTEQENSWEKNTVAEEANTPTGSVLAPPPPRIELQEPFTDIEIIPSHHTPHITHGGTEKRHDDGDWSPEEYERIKEMVQRFRNRNRIDWDDLERNPAYRRSQLELWRHPNLPPGEMEQVRLT